MPGPIDELAKKRLAEAEDRVRRAHQDALSKLDAERARAQEEIRQRLSKAAEEFASSLRA